MAKVAILSSTDELLSSAAYTSNFLPALQNGLGSPATIITVSAKGDYDPQSQGNIKGVANTLPTDANLIVSIGGLVTAEAVAALNPNKYRMPFLAIVGRTPTEGSAILSPKLFFLGGVDLDTTPQQNRQRTKLLMMNYSVSVTDVSKIWLLYNINSQMGQQEADDWTFHGGFALASSVDQKNYAANQFATDFNNLPGTAQALVVSGDPFFASKANDLVAAAKTWNKPVCYPNGLYEAAGAQHGTSMIYGANLNNAYAALGAKANTYLANMANTFLGVDIQAQSTKVLIVHPVKGKKSHKSGRKR